MPNPYAAKGPVRQVRERDSDLTTFVRRLESLGALPDEIEAAIDGWDVFDAEWTPEYRRTLVRSTDSVLRDHLTSVRAEYLYATVPEEVLAERAEANALARAKQEAYDRIGGTVQAIVSWVADDRHRAEAVLSLEASAEGAQRATLLRRMRSIVDGGWE